jgi:hypothetical protein
MASVCSSLHAIVRLGLSPCGPSARRLYDCRERPLTKLEIWKRAPPNPAGESSLEFRIRQFVRAGPGRVVANRSCRRAEACFSCLSARKKAKNSESGQKTCSLGWNIEPFSASWGLPGSVLNARWTQKHNIVVGLSACADLRGTDVRRCFLYHLLS